MPAREPKPGQVRLHQFANEDRLLTVRCSLCRKQVNYLVDDLIEVLGGDWDAHVPPFPCSRCKTKEWMGVQFGFVGKSDVGVLEVRRPWRVVTIQKWKTVKLGDDPAKTEKADPVDQAVSVLRYR